MSHRSCWFCRSVGAVVLGLAVASVAVAEESPAEVLERFAVAWPEDRTPYRTEEDTTSWRAYSLAMKQLVAMGDPSIPVLTDACHAPNFQVRALAARVLGLLEARQATPQLIELLDDPQPSVASLAADALGQIRDPAGLRALEKAQGALRNGDVLLHISKALERAVPLEEDVREQVVRIDEASIDGARVGDLAPEFTLRDADGKPWRLADFRGKKSVVLVFIYGDG